jgi:hypothetical protein
VNTAITALPDSAEATAKPVETGDPIFAVIEEHRAANQSWADRLRRHRDFLAAFAGPGPNDSDDPAWPDCEAAGEREGEAYHRLWHTMPTTAAGFAALFTYFQNPRWPGHSDGTAYADSIFQDAVDNAWFCGDEDGDGGMPGLMQWLQLMELALRHMATN